MKGNVYLGDIGIDGGIRLKLNLKEQDRRMRTGLIWRKIK
jgi:hypothetical protein